MREFNDGNGKRRWTYISRKLGKNYTPRIVKYRILLLNAINSINQGIEPDIERQDPLDLNDEEEDVNDNDEITEIISFEDLKKKYYRNRVNEAYFIDPDADKSDEEEESVHRRRITFRYENSEDNEIPRNRKKIR